MKSPKRTVAKSTNAYHLSVSSLRAQWRERKTFLTLTLGLLTICLTGCPNKPNTPTNPEATTSGTSGESGVLLTKLKAALAATENLDTVEASQLWDDLNHTIPDDPSIKLNRAINSVLYVDSLTATATDSVKSNDDRKAARLRLPDAMDAARSAVEDFAIVSGDDVTNRWLIARIDAHEASLLRGSLTKSLRRDLLKRLSEAIDGDIGKNPRAVILGGPLSDLLEKLSDPIDGVPEEFLRPAAKSLRRLSDLHQSNLFLALRALQLSIDEENVEAERLVARTWDLAAAVEPTLATYTKPIGLTPKQLADQITAAIQEDDWAKAEQSYVIWSNVLGPLEILRTDRRRTSPHPLDRLNFDALRRLSWDIASGKPIPPDEGDLGFQTQTLADSAALVLPFDADLDLDLDLVAIGDVVQLWRNDSATWDLAATLESEDEIEGILAADLFMVDSSDSDRVKATSSQPTDDEEKFATSGRHDTIPSLLAFGEFGIKMIQVDTRKDTSTEQVLTWVDGTTGLESIKAVQAVVTGDLEGDGDLDLIVAQRDGRVRTLVNRGNRTFFEAAVGADLTDSDDPVDSMAIADLDRDLDLDVVCIHSKSGKTSLLENLLHLQFRRRYLDEVPPIAVSEDDPSLFVAVEDVDGNVGWDILVASSNASQVAFGNSADIGVWAVDRVETGKGFSTPPIIADLDNDAYFEWVATDSAARVGPFGISVSSRSFAEDLGTRSVHVADIDSNGKVDLVSVKSGSVTVARNVATNESHHVDVRFRGIADNAAASGRVNHYAIGSVLELRFGPHYRSRIVTGPSTHFGLDGFDSADSIRIIMPNGLTQSIRNPKVDTVVEEEQTLKGSCPYLYGWDGQQFAFVTDCLWAAPLGLQVAAGVVQKDRPWEFLKVDGKFLRPNADGEYELRLTEELWEVAYVDQMELIAVDHPDDTDIFTNEKVGPPNIAQERIYCFGNEDLCDLQSATGSDGSSITDVLRDADERYHQGFDRRLRQGLCPPHWIDLDFNGTASEPLKRKSNASVFLVLRGWILPTDTSLNIQIDQNPELPPIEFPSVWVPDQASESGWRNAIPTMGFPGGKTKTIVVDVTNHVQKDDLRFRIRTSAQIYWDSAQLAVQDAVPEFQTQRLRLSSAEVAWHGFSRRIQSVPSAPETYDYQQADLDPKWPPLLGQLTSFGDCTSMLTHWDDSMVVISGGDEVRARFKVPSENPPEGWTRDFVLHCVGWDKDADLNTLTGQSTGPLPIRDMRDYPPTAMSIESFESVLRKNKNSLRRRQSFRSFWRR